MTDGRFPALSVRQPWADLILAGEKDVENRSRRTHMRGTVLIHASAKAPTQYDIDWVSKLMRKIADFTATDEYEPNGLGCILGMVDIVDSVTKSGNPWFDGPHGWVLARPVMFKKPIPYKGAVGFFYVPVSVLKGTPAARATHAQAAG